MPMHTGQVCVFGSAPNRVLHPQNSLLSVDKLHVHFQADDRGVTVTHSNESMLTTKDTEMHEDRMCEDIDSLLTCVHFCVSLWLSTFDFKAALAACANRSPAHTSARRAAVSLPAAPAPAVASRSASPLSIVRTASTIPAMPARLALTVYRSTRYIASGSSAISPSLNAGDGRDRPGDQIDFLERPVEILPNQPPHLERLQIVRVVVAGAERVRAEHDPPLHFRAQILRPASGDTSARAPYRDDPSPARSPAASSCFRSAASSASIAFSSVR